MTSYFDKEPEPETAALGLIGKALESKRSAERELRTGTVQRAQDILDDAQGHLAHAGEWAERSDDSDGGAWLAHWREQAAAAEAELNAFRGRLSEMSRIQSDLTVAVTSLQEAESEWKQGGHEPAKSTGRVRQRTAQGMLNGTWDRLADARDRLEQYTQEAGLSPSLDAMWGKLVGAEDAAGDVHRIMYPSAARDETEAPPVEKAAGPERQPPQPELPARRVPELEL